MEPNLIEGDRLLIVPLAHRRVEPGMILAVRRPEYRKHILVKRCGSVGHDGSVELVGDNPSASTDSRQFGRVMSDAVLGRVVYRYGPAGRAGPL